MLRSRETSHFIWNSMDFVLGKLTKFGYDLVDKGVVPDWILRSAVRYLCKVRLSSLPLPESSYTSHAHYKSAFVSSLKSLPSITAPGSTRKANDQHYEVSTAFILSCLGPRAKYSACLWERDGPDESRVKTLAEAEEAIMDLYCARANLSDGMDVLDLGCGWGSLSLYLAEKYPSSRIVGLSNSATQKAHIDSVAKEKKLLNLKIITADVNSHEFDGQQRFDRILSIEMFEHMKNYELLLHKVSNWLKSPSETVDGSDALLFIHIFCHKTTPYHFDDDDSWMARTFFSGGTMSSHDLLLHFQSDVTLLKSWWLDGKHYARTLEAWLQLQDKNAKKGLAELERDADAKGMGREEGRKAFYRFRLFFLACAEFFALNDGEEWGVGHYLFKRKL
ncbi:S-adenosyl-L-methionine-dependent methyltransferase [Gautieria morchelliformis]|nr:S-adenosyl-L-methionine-dependent methyltransferase [Gautieria morchelliformis]